MRVKDGGASARSTGRAARVGSASDATTAGVRVAAGTAHADIVRQSGDPCDPPQGGAAGDMGAWCGAVGVARLMACVAACGIEAMAHGVPLPTQSRLRSSTLVTNAVNRRSI